MNINYELYKIFYTVAKRQSISNAAKELNISQPAISKSIKNLEEQLKGQLFIRTRKGVALTEEGKEFYKYISEAIEYINNAEHKFTELVNLETGTVKIGVNTTLTKNFLLPYLRKFHELYPKIKIEIIPGLSTDTISKLRMGLLDIVILNLSKDSYGKDLKIIKCKEIHDCFAVNNSYKKLLNKGLSLKDLNNYPLILPAKNSNARTFLDELTKKENITLNPSIELASYSLVAEFASIGLGIGYVTKEYIKSYLENKELYILNIKETIPQRYIGIVLSKNNLPSFSTKKLIELITKRL